MDRNRIAAGFDSCLKCCGLADLKMKFEENSRAAELISLLQLAPHPEGGFFRRIYRSSLEVQPLDGREVRPALTSIFYLLADGDRSCWHRVASDEAWHFYEGDSLELFCANEDFSKVERHLLGRVADGLQPVCIIPANHWQAARTTGGFSLVGCSVGPGFDFADFEMLREDLAGSEEFRKKKPDLADLL